MKNTKIKNIFGRKNISEATCESVQEIVNDVFKSCWVTVDDELYGRFDFQENGDLASEFEVLEREVTKKINTLYLQRFEDALKKLYPDANVEIWEFGDHDIWEVNGEVVPSDFEGFEALNDNLAMASNDVLKDAYKAFEHEYLDVCKAFAGLFSKL